VLHALAARWAVRAEQAEEFARRAREVSPVPLSLAQVERSLRAHPLRLYYSRLGLAAALFVWFGGWLGRCHTLHRISGCSVRAGGAPCGVVCFDVAGCWG